MPRHRRHAAAVSLLLLAAGCSMPSMVEATSQNTRLIESGPSVAAGNDDQLAGMGEPAITHGALNRSRTRSLNATLEDILKATLPVVARLHGELTAVTDRLVPPESLATTDANLRAWGQASRDNYHATVDVIYDEAHKRLQSLADSALATAESQARMLAPPRAPLDTGATGDPSLDTAVTSFDEVVDGAVGLREIETRHQQDRSRQVDLFEIFSTFGSKEPDGTTDAEADLKGRILLFVGGDETLGAPRAVLAFRTDAGEPDEHRFAQVTRHRVMRGPTIVSDLGWRAAPMPGRAGQPQTEVLDRYLVAPRVEPAVDRTAPGYDQLRDMRVVVDIQSAVLGADGKVLGGVDWRVEFQVSTGGALTWQLAGGRPKFDPYCSEVKAVLGL